MSTIRNLTLSAAAALAIAAPMAASAAEIHQAPTEQGYVQYPDHREPSADRGVVVADLKAAMQDPAWSQKSRGVPSGMAAPNADGLSRAQVERETIGAMRAGQIPSGDL